MAALLFTAFGVDFDMFSLSGVLPLTCRSEKTGPLVAALLFTGFGISFDLYEPKRGLAFDLPKREKGTRSCKKRLVARIRKNRAPCRHAMDFRIDAGGPETTLAYVARALLLHFYLECCRDGVARSFPKCELAWTSLFFARLTGMELPTPRAALTRFASETLLLPNLPPPPELQS